MMPVNLSVFIAFSAGLMSFLSPCVLPLIPSWLCVIGGSPMIRKKQTGNDEIEEKKESSAPKPIARTVSFVLGFTAVFVFLSIIFSATFIAFEVPGLKGYINIASGIIVIILGLNMIFNFISFLNLEKRFHFINKPKGIIGAFFLGSAFGAGWTPCIGPALTGILMLAAQGGITQAVLYLTVFSLGLGLPFILAALSFDFFLKVSKKLRNILPVIQRVCGVLLVIIGIFIITGHYRIFSEMTARWQR